MRTGKGGLVHTSLYNVGLWCMSAYVTNQEQKEVDDNMVLFTCFYLFFACFCVFLLAPHLPLLSLLTLPPFSFPLPSPPPFLPNAHNSSYILTSVPCLTPIHRYPTLPYPTPPYPTPISAMFPFLLLPTLQPSSPPPLPHLLPIPSPRSPISLPLPFLPTPTTPSTDPKTGSMYAFKG